ncbi:apolipoprotein N-acyltransferase [Antribacter gilvus]|uniref:apolipoprotein N-acyltransferase n=1 Tax=Antribacter gilvus TaxID=2304675 RepID=UPI000F79F571|nr:apolipoprotein N-acyltransferase [Antribacter gilvus]
MIHREPSRLLTLLLAPVGGLALWAAFPDVAFWPAAFVAVALLWFALGRRGAWWNFLVGLIFGLSFFLSHLWWSNVSTDAAPWIALSLLQALFFAGLGVLWTWARRALDPWTFAGAGLARAAAFAVLFAAVEQWRSETPFGGFPWGRVAWAMVDAPVGRAAWLGGSVLVTILVVLVSVLAAQLVGAGIQVLLQSRHSASALSTESDDAGAAQASRTPVPAAGWGATAGAVLLGAAFVVGPLALPLPSPDDLTDEALQVGAVQGNVGEPGLGSFANRAEVLNNHLDGTRALLDEVDPGDLDVVLWPENGSDLDPQTTRDVARDIDAAAVDVEAPILVGAQEWPETGGRYNVLLLWQPGEGVTERYAKQHPVPFGEYIPIRSFVRMLSAQVDRVQTDMLPGFEPGIIDLPVERLGRDVRLGTVICFEVSYEEIVRDSVQRGAEVLIVPTNNASFGFTAESTQQLAISRMQAITTGRSTVQISTVGVSGIIAADGTLLESTSLFTADQMIADLPLRTELSPAVVAGYWPGWITGGLAALLVVAGIATGIRTRTRV